MQQEHHPDVISRNARYGLILFIIYVIFYAGFMGLCAFAPEVMAKKTPLGSVNLAIMYGMGLIFAALVLAMVYMFLCGKRKQD